MEPSWFSPPIRTLSHSTVVLASVDQCLRHCSRILQVGKGPAFALDSSRTADHRWLRGKHFRNDRIIPFASREWTFIAVAEASGWSAAVTPVERQAIEVRMIEAAVRDG